eukprot:scaffold2638_cov114-Cylindrotheca_fusiformis.AAC.2
MDSLGVDPTVHYGGSSILLLAYIAAVAQLLLRNSICGTIESLKKDITFQSNLQASNWLPV